MLSTKHYASESLVQEVVNKVGDVFAKSKDTFFSLINSDMNLSKTDMTRILKNFETSSSDFSSAFHSESGFLRSSFCRKKHYQQTLNLNLPIEKPLFNDNGEDSGCHYSYIPFLDTVSVVLKDPETRRYFENTKIKNNGRMMFDINDGQIFKQNEIIKNNTNTVQVIIFQDAFELCNPIGASKTKFKMVAIYAVFLNLPTHLKTKYGNIRLVLLCLESYIKDFGWDKILKEFVNDLKIFETEGITLIIDGEYKTFKGLLIVVLGDNLGSHQIGCYIESFSKSIYFCRYCSIPREEFENNIFQKRKLRTIEQYKECVKLSKENGKHEKGIKRDCLFNELSTYHTQQGLPPCVAHDLFEGVVKEDMYLAIDYFVTKKWFKIGLFNYRINNVTISGYDKVFIPKVNLSKGKKKLDGTASQVRSLLLLFPIAVADRVKNFNDSVRKMVLHLRAVCSLVCAPAISYRQIALLKLEIDNYLRLRIECFPNKSLIPKHEFVYHFPMLTYLYGPLKHTWGLRFESEHQEFKNLIKRIPNFINVTQSLASRYQLKKAAFPLCTQSFVEAKHAFDCISINFKDTKWDSIRKIFIDNDTNTYKLISYSVTFLGIKYEKDMSICIGINEYGNYEICKIECIIINVSYTDVIFVGRKQEIIFNSFLGLYENGDNNLDEKLQYFPHSLLLAPDPIPEVVLCGVQAYTPKYTPLEPDYEV